MPAGYDTGQIGVREGADDRGWPFLDTHRPQSPQLVGDHVGVVTGRQRDLEEVVHAGGPSLLVLLAQEALELGGQVVGVGER